MLAFAMVFLEVLPVHLFQAVEVVGAFRVHALVDDKVFPFFLRGEGFAAVGAAQFHGGEAALAGGEPGGADLAQELALGAVIPVQEGFRGITAGAGAVAGDVTSRPATDRADLSAVAFFVVGDELFVSPVLAEVGDQRELVNLEFLVSGGMGIIKSPLLKRDISADKTD